jgi:hypothetical protein
MMHKRTLLILLLITSPAFSDCMRDSSGRSICGHGPCAKDFRGEIYCAKDRFGTATRDDHGNVVCGLGQCEKDMRGNIYCSSESGGDVLRNDRGEVDCFGTCQLASVEFCERSIAGQ